MALEDMKMMGLAPEPLQEMKGKLEEDVAGLSMEEDAMFMEMAPKGKFSKAALNSLVKAHNKVSEMFGLPEYPAFDADQTEFPVKFVRELAMIMAAVEDAIAAGEVGQEMAIDLASVKGDRDLASLAGRLDMLAKSKDFRKWLSSKPEEEVATKPEMEVSETEMAAPGEGEIDQLMMSRM